MTEALKDHIKAVIDGLRGMHLDDATDLIAAVADEMGETRDEIREIETILDGMRWIGTASLSVDRNGVLILRVDLPDSTHTYEWPSEADAPEDIRAAIAAMRAGDAT